MTRTQTSSSSTVTIVFPPIEENLSKDVITEILKHISDVPMLCLLRCLNKNFRKLVDQDVIWENLLIRENLFSPDIKREKPLKDVFADLTCYRFDPTLTQAKDGDGNNWLTWDDNHTRASNRGKWRVNIALRAPISKGQHYYEFTVQNDTNIGIVTREFLENVDAAQEIGSNNTYSFGYAMTGNLAICGKWLRGKCERHKATSMCEVFTTMLMGVLSDSSIIIGMLVDLDNGFIQYWKDGVLQGACAYIYDRAEIKDLPTEFKSKKNSGFYVTTTLYNSGSSIQINRPPKFPLNSLIKYDKPPNARVDWAGNGGTSELCY